MSIPHTPKQWMKYASERLAVASQEIEVALAALANLDDSGIDTESLYGAVELVTRQSEILAEKVELK